MKYTEWKLLTEAFGSGMTLGLSRPNTVGGLVGARLSEEGFGEDDEEEDDEDEESEDDEEFEDDDLSDQGDEELSDDIFGNEEEGPDKSFPPDSAEKLDGLPTPDEEMLSGEEDDDGMGDTLANIDPELAGLGDEGDELPPEISGGDEMGDELPPELSGLGGEMGDEMGDELPPEISGGDEMGDELPPEISGEMGDEMGEPCPDCNPDGGEESDPDCPTCQGMGFLDNGEENPLAIVGGDGIDADIEENDPAKDQNSAMLDLMARMQDYCKKYMQASPDVSAPAMMKKEGFLREMAPAMAAMGRAALAQGAKSAGAAAANKAVNAMTQPREPGKRFMAKNCKCENKEDFLSTLRRQAAGTVNKKFSSGMREDALIPSQEKYQEPQPGQPGFAPQGKVGGIGGNYTMDDFNDLPVLGESKRWPTLADYTKWKKRHK